MLEHFSDQEITELLELGELSPKDRSDDRFIEKSLQFDRQGNIKGSVYMYCYTQAGSGERRTPWYRTFDALLFCEFLTFDDLRRNWLYYGTLLNSPHFCEQLVHDERWCPCRLCLEKSTPLGEEESSPIKGENDSVGA